MSIASYAAFVTECNNPARRSRWSRNGNGNALASTNVMADLWTASLAQDEWGFGTPAAPTTAAVPVATDTGSLLHYLGASFGGSSARIVQVDAGMAGSASGAQSVAGVLMLYDRLSHQGGLVGNVNTVQTTNLPTAALTRYTDGVGVLPCVEIYTLIGLTGTTLTASYTNQAGTSGQTTQPVSIASVAKDRSASRMIVLPLADGDTGCRAVASVTLAASTGTAGNFGVTLVKPLAMIPIVGDGQVQVWNGLLSGGGNLEPLVASAHIAPAWLAGDFAFGVNGLLQGELRVGFD